VARELVEPLRAYGAYAAALEPGDHSSAAAELLRYLGRDPRWTAGADDDQVLSDFVQLAPSAPDPSGEEGNQMRLRNWLAVVVSVLLLVAVGIVGVMVNRSALRAADTVHRSDSLALAVNNSTLAGQMQQLSAKELKIFADSYRSTSESASPATVRRWTPSSRSPRRSPTAPRSPRSTAAC
jgi:hypothetical protein